MGETAADVVVGLVWLVCGGLLWRRREHRRTGLLMAATGATWLAGSAAGPLVLLHRGPLAHMLLAYPGAALVGLGERLVVAGAYLDGAILPVGRDPAATLLLAAAIVGVAAWRFLRETGAVRRSRTAPGVAAALVAAVLAAGAIGRVTGVEFGDYMSLTYDGILVAAALMLFADLRTGGWARAAVADLVIDLGAGGSDTLTRRLARAVGDPSLAVAYALDDGVTFVDEGGRRVELPGANAIRTVTRFDDGGRTVAAVTHDPAALRDPELLVGARAALCVAVANVRLQADVRRRVADVEHSRRRLLSASDEERRRVATELDGNVMPHLDDAARLITFARNGDDDSEVADLESRLSAASAQLRRLTLGLPPPGSRSMGWTTRFGNLSPTRRSPSLSRFQHSDSRAKSRRQRGLSARRRSRTSSSTPMPRRS